jgi:uncharacterized protein YraI
MKKFVFALILLCLLAGCNLPSAAPQAAPTIDAGMVGTIAAMTLEAMNTSTPAFTNTPAATSTPNATATVTPTITPTYELPQARFDGNTNCRQGPGPEYSITTVVRSGQKAEVVGKAEQGNYWVVKNPNLQGTSSGDGTCWVAGDFAQTSGSLHLLPTMTAPPTPTPEPPQAPTWKNWNYNCTFAPGGSDATVELAWSDNSRNEQGYNVYRNDQLIAALGPDVSAYTDVAFVSLGQSLSYVIEAYSAAGRARSSAVTVTCQ